MNIGIIGLGRMGKNHLKTLQQLKESSKTLNAVDDIYIYDTNAEETEVLSKQYSVKACCNVKDLRDVADAIIIATPTHTHYEIANYFIEYCKDVFIEKPITSTVEEAKIIIENIDKRDLICMVGHVELFNPAILYLIEYLKGKSILSLSAERISKVEKGRCFDVDAVRDLMIHDIDIILSIIHCKINKIAAVSNSKDLNDVFAILQFENDVTANLKVNRLAFERSRELYINTDEEAIHLDFIKRKIDFHRPHVNKTLENEKYANQIIGVKETIYFDGDSLKNELLHFLDCVQARTKPISNECTAGHALEIATHIANNATKAR